MKHPHLSRRAALATLGAGAATAAGLARAQTPIAYEFMIAPDRGLGLAPTLACTHGTVEQGEGPFYTPATPRRDSLREPDTAAAPLVLSGLVLTPDCRPVAGAVVDLWHCDESGIYDNAGFRYRGHQFTDSSGAYRFETIRPGLYPGRTAHIHAKVQGPATALLTTQVYFPDLPDENFADRIYRDDLLILLRRTAAGWDARFDFVVPAAKGGV